MESEWFYGTMPLKWLNKEEGRVALDISTITKKKINTAEISSWNTGSSEIKSLSDECLLMQTTGETCSSNRNVIAIPKEYTRVNSLFGGDEMEVFFDGKELLINKITQERKKEEYKKFKEAKLRIKKGKETKKMIPNKNRGDKEIEYSENYFKKKYYNESSN